MTFMRVGLSHFPDVGMRSSALSRPAIASRSLGLACLSQARYSGEGTVLFTEEAQHLFAEFFRSLVADPMAGPFEDRQLGTFDAAVHHFT
jgi:hypothetical protein